MTRALPAPGSGDGRSRPPRGTGQPPNGRAEPGRDRLHQSGGCCDGSSPMCFPVGDFMTGPSDVLLGEVAGFSVEAPEGARFLIRSRLFTDEEADQLPEPVHG